MKKILMIGNALIDETSFKDLDSIRIDNQTEKGITIEKAYKKIKQHLKKNNDYEYAIVSFGSNESEYVWHYVNQQVVFKPQVEVKKFRKKYDKLLKLLSKYPIKPILLTTPPVIKKDFYQWILNQINDDLTLLQDLNCEDKVYYYHELYNSAVVELFHKHQTKIINLKEVNQGNYEDLLKDNLIYLNQKGQSKINEFITSEVKNILNS